MKKLILLLLVIIGLSSCSTVYYSSVMIDQVSPASIQFPAGIRKVGLIDRLNLKKENQPSNPIALNSGEFTQKLAVQLSEAEYFDDVILCDSDVSLWDRSGATSLKPLSREHVQDLCEDLDVDMIVSTERSYATLLNPEPVPVIYTETVLRLYVPNRNNPLKTLVLNDTIVWGVDDINLLGSPMIYKAVREDIESHMAQKNAFYLAPHWQQVERIYYASGNADMRDGAYMVSQNDWEKAGEIWSNALQNAKGKLKAQYEYNMILYYEMTGNMDEAYRRCCELEQRVKEQYQDVYFWAMQYKTVLAERVKDVQVLNLQMKRFE